MLSRRNFILSMLGASCAAHSASALTVKNVEYISIAKLAQTCGMRWKTTVENKAQTVFGKISKMDFAVNSRAMTLNGTTVWLGHPVVESGGMLHISTRDYFKTIRPILFPQTNGTPKKLFHIFIDPGHGGKDRGAMNAKYRLTEKAVALDIAGRLGKELRKNGYKVSFSRLDDSFVELPDRPAMANSRGADLFLSIHCNAAAPSINGVETFALAPRAMPSTSSAKISRGDYEKYPGHANDEWNQMLAYYIQRALRIATGSPDRGVKRARFAVLKGAKMPAALVECGFISNNGECAKMMSANYRQLLAQTIASAVIAYHNTLRRISKK